MTVPTNAKLLRSSNFRDIEKLAEKIHASDLVKLQIPNTLSFSGAFGMEGAALQLLATWLRTPQPHILHTSVQDPAESENFEDLCNSLFGLCSLRLSDVIWSAGKHEIDLSIALLPAVPIFSNMRDADFSHSFKGMYVTLPAIKSAVIRGGKDRELDSPLYNGSAVVGATKFLEITEKCIAVALPQRSRNSQIIEEVVAHISEIVRELFTNTHRHARSDVHENPLANNFRGIIFNGAEVTKARLEQISKSGGGKLSLFLADWLPKNNRKLQLLDITVVDSGPGFARRWNRLDKDEMTLDMEKKAVVECFKKHRSTDTSDSSGSGLSNILKDLRLLKGWFRLRTGRTLVEKSFFEHQGKVNISMEDVKGVNCFLEGVVFNIAIPLGNTGGK